MLRNRRAWSRARKSASACGSLILIAIIVMIFSSRNEKATLEPVLKKLDAIEKRLDAMDRRMGQPKEMAGEGMAAEK